MLLGILLLLQGVEISTFSNSPSTGVQYVTREMCPKPVVFLDPDLTRPLLSFSALERVRQVPLGFKTSFTRCQLATTFHQPDFFMLLQQTDWYLPPLHPWTFTVKKRHISSHQATQNFQMASTKPMYSDRLL